MMNFRIIKEINDIKVIKSSIFEDERGYIIKHFEKDLLKNIGINIECFEEMENYSKKGVMRGLHFQKGKSQAKLLRVIDGRIYDVVVDLRKKSCHYGEWFGFYMDNKDRNLLYVPEGFAHGFVTLSESARCIYKAGAKYIPENDGGILWSDPKLNIEWPNEIKNQIIVSSKDKQLPTFLENEEMGNFIFD